jgi:hypothetical protein
MRTIIYYVGFDQSIFRKKGKRWVRSIKKHPGRVVKRTFKQPIWRARYSDPKNFLTSFNPEPVIITNHWTVGEKENVAQGVEK